MFWFIKKILGVGCSFVDICRKDGKTSEKSIKKVYASPWEVSWPVCCVAKAKYHMMMETARACW